MKFLLTACATALLVVMPVLAGNLAASEAAARPNLVLIVADDLGFSDLGCYGSEINTPNLDKLAATGIRFTDLHSTGRCWPSRSCLISGYYPQQIHADPPNGMVPAWSPLLPKRLKSLGYWSYHSGKWHVPGVPDVTGIGGFAESFDCHGGNHFIPKSMLDEAKSGKAKKGKSGDTDGEFMYTATAVSDMALRYLDQHQSQHAADPFFLYLAYIEPHFPLQAPAEDIARCKGRYDAGWDVIRAERFKRQQEMNLVNCGIAPFEPGVLPSASVKLDVMVKKVGPGEVDRAVPWASLTPVQQHFQAQKMEIHAAMIERMDAEIGRVLERISKMGQLDNTLVMFVSDNGASAEELVRGGGNDPNAPMGSLESFLCVGPGWASSSNTPFRLHKSFVHEGGVSSPGIICWPAGIKAQGELRHGACHFVDVAPTFLEAAGAPLAVMPGAPPLPGRSLVPAFTRDGQLSTETLFFLHQGNAALRMGDWKLVRLKSSGAWELYDLSNDRCEQVNLAAAQPERLREMAQEWERREKEFSQQAGPATKVGKKNKDDEEP